MVRYVHDYTDLTGPEPDPDLLGGKGANLARMVRLGLPVPPGFTISTEACRRYLADGTDPTELADQVSVHLAGLEKELGRALGDLRDPLLVSVRSGARHSMPGMMETVLNIGLNDQSVHGLAAQAGGGPDADRFAWDSYRRLIQMFGRTVLGIDADRFEEALTEAKRARATDSDLDLDAADLREVAAEFKAVVRDATGQEFPQAPRDQLDLAIRARALAAGAGPAPAGPGHHRPAAQFVTERT